MKLAAKLSQIMDAAKSKWRHFNLLVIIVGIIGCFALPACGPVHSYWGIEGDHYTDGHHHHHKPPKKHKKHKKHHHHHDDDDD